MRAIEFGQLLAGPFTGTLLGDFGADVIKIEAPEIGDAMRDWGRLRHNDRSLWWSILARNKRSVALNLREPEGQRIAAELAATADIVLENFRPGTMEKWGLGPEDLHERNPGADLRARVRLRPDRPLPRPPGLRVRGRGDLRPAPHQRLPRPGAAALRHLASATRSPRSRRSRASCSPSSPARTGAEGQVVDASIVDACFAMSESSTLEYEKTGFVREPTGPRLPRIAPSNVYCSKDGKWVVIAANHDTLWRRLAKIMGQPELGEDERFATHHARGEHEDLLDEIIGAFAAQHTAEELDEIVNGGGVVCAPVYTAEDVYKDPYFRERELLVETEDEVHGPVTVPGVVPKLSRTPGSIRQAARWTVGADTDAVLEELGVTAEQRKQLADDGVI